MLLLIGVALTLTGVVLTWRGHGASRLEAANLGSVSEQWLAEHRAT